MPEASLTFSPKSIILLSIGFFIAQLLLHLLINPDSFYKQPSNERADEMVENRGSRAMGIFAIVLVVISFVNNSQSISEIIQTKALVTTLLAASFLMFAFVSELIGGLNKYIFKFQEDCLTYAGLLLFSGLYFIISSIEAASILAPIIKWSAILSWLIWGYYKYVYLFEVQLHEWNAIGTTRQEYLQNRIQSLYNSIID